MLTFPETTVSRCHRRPVRRAQVYDGEQIVWIQGDEIHNQFERGLNLPGHSREAISAGREAGFGMMMMRMMENRVLSSRDTGASIVDNLEL